VALPPLSCGVLLPLPLLQAFLLLVAGRVPPLLLSPASLFIYSFVTDCPSPPFSAQGALPSLLHVFFIVVYYSVWFFSLFSLGGGRSVQGAMLISPRVVCGCTVCYLAHLVVCFSRAGRRWHLAVWEPSWFLCYHEVEMLCAGWECGGVGVLPLLDGFSCKVYLQRFSKILL
jgi:hypothetical protein